MRGSEDFLYKILNIELFVAFCVCLGLCFCVICTLINQSAQRNMCGCQTPHLIFNFLLNLISNQYSIRLNLVNAH
jgi:hypothetical protein